MRTATLASLSLLVLGCGPKTESGPQLPDVSYAGKASDEALGVMWPKLPNATSDERLSLTLPAPDSTVALGTPPTITWTEYASLEPHRMKPAMPGSPHRGFSLVSRAWAHLLPVTGKIYLVELDQGTSTLRIFTTNATYTPTTIEWQQLTGGIPGTINVRIWSAYMEANAITEGPYVSPNVVSFKTAATP